LQLPLKSCQVPPYRASPVYSGYLVEACVGSTESFDLVVVGCGPAGEKAGAQAAYFGKRVAVIERGQYVGGSCINTGTVPSKTLRESALFFSLSLHDALPIMHELLQGLLERHDLLRLCDGGVVDNVPVRTAWQHV